jgi:hypothetical protein
MPSEFTRRCAILPDMLSRSTDLPRFANRLDARSASVGQNDRFFSSKAVAKTAGFLLKQGRQLGRCGSIPMSPKIEL